MSIVDRCLKALNSPTGRRRRVVIAFWSIPASIILWPVSSLTFAKGEPLSVLALSWLAITVTAIDVLTSSQIHEEGTNGDDDQRRDADGS